MTENQRKAWIRAQSGARAIGSFAAKALDPAARARGFATTSLLTDWPAIVGRELAQFTMPDKVVWPRRREESETGDAKKGRRGDGAVLVLRVDGPRAIEVQHRSGQILERVNTYFGYRAVTEMRLLQAPVVRAAKRGSRRPMPAPADALPAHAGIEDEGLRKALSRLGATTRRRLTRG
ncbi:MAG: DUF721 domain-containing protein [Methyloceanibacter sp.]